MEEASISIDNSQAEEAAVHAELSSEAANEAAVAANAAAVNQAQIIDIVTSAAREDAERARSQAEASAESSRAYAEVADLAVKQALSEMKLMMEEYGTRLTAMETKHSQPVVVNNDSVNPINPSDVEDSARDESMSESDGEEGNTRKRKHGRRSR